MNILVIDVGTSSMRGVLYDEEGRDLDHYAITYAPHSPEPGLMEQDPKSWSDALLRICAQINLRARLRGNSIDAITMTSQRSSVVPVDESGQPVRPAIMWQDKRNAGILEELKSCEDMVIGLSGARLNTVFSGSKMTWFRRNEPELYARTYKLCTTASYLTRCITGEYKTDHTYGARSQMMNIRTGQWVPELLDLFEVEVEKLCELVPPGSIAGYVSPEFARETGLPEGIPYISAGGDQQCSALGQGIYRDGAMEITVGTGAFLLKYSDEPFDVRGSGIICGSHSMPGKYVLEGSMLVCASLYNWANRVLYGDGGLETINEAVGEVPPGSKGVLALPYFQGRGTPDWNNQARGAILNLELGSGAAEIARSILESLAYEIRNNTDILNSMGNPAGYIRLGGGLTRQPSFAQIVSDVLEAPVVINKKASDESALGAWMLASVTMGIHPDMGSAFEAAAWNTRLVTYEPQPENFEVYRDRRAEMNRMYRALNQG